MKKLNILPIAMLMFGAAQSMAIPANPAPGLVQQPDGTSITVQLRGDEFRNFLTTPDGYTVMQDATGVWRYAEPTANGELIAGKMQVHDAELRSDDEIYYLASLTQYLTPQATDAQKQLKELTRTSASNPKGLYNYKNFKGLVILVNYNDRSFSEPNSHGIFNDIVNKADYTGFTPNGSTAKQVYTGSVRDYFHDNSAGLFTPTFDVVGPVTVPYSQYYVNQTANIRPIVAAACAQADDLVDFSKYDTNNDGVVDMFYLIFAGFGSNNTGNDQRLVWPHASTMPGNVFDGVKLGRYACSTEFYGVSYAHCVDGIGTICHEFSHVLGLMDEYDTDYGGSGGQSVDPGEWSVMAGGSYNNYSRTPVGYSLMQRFQSGFTVPKLITGAGEWTVKDIDQSNFGYRINTSNPKEYFLIENRRKVNTKWNKYLPGQGMLIYRVDSTDTNPWSKNTINADPTHNYYEMVRACPKGSGLAIVDSDGDPFPGSGNVTSVGPFSEPGLISWGDRYKVTLQINDINEAADGVITFKTANAEGGDDCEDFENMTTSSSSDQKVQGKYCKWTFYKAAVYSPGANLCNGSKAVGMIKNSTLETSTIKDMESVSMRLFNSASRTFNIRLQYYDPEISGWVGLKDKNGLVGTTIDANGSATVRFDIPEAIRPSTKLQLKVVSGSDTDRLYVDDIQMRGVHSGITTATADDARMQVSLLGNRLLITGAAAPIAVYDIAGRRVALGDNNITLPARGIYIVTDGISTVKIAF